MRLPGFSAGSCALATYSKNRLAFGGMTAAGRSMTSGLGDGPRAVTLLNGLGARSITAADVAWAVTVSGMGRARRGKRDNQGRGNNHFPKSRFHILPCIGAFRFSCTETNAVKICAMTATCM